MTTSIVLGAAIGVIFALVFPRFSRRYSSIFLSWGLILAAVIIVLVTVL